MLEEEEGDSTNSLKENSTENNSKTVEEGNTHCPEDLSKPNKNTQKEANSTSTNDEVPPIEKIRAQLKDALERDHELEYKIESVIENMHKESLEAREKIAQTFREAHEKLSSEEAIIMNDLEKACNEADETLRDILEALKKVSDDNDLLYKVCGYNKKYSGGIEEIKEVEKQITLSNEFREMKMTDLKFYWDNVSRVITIKRHLFNGVPDLIRIEFSNVFSKSIDISWICDESNLSEEDKKEMSFVVEMKKALSDKEWKEVYSGNSRKCSVNRLDTNTEYKVRIRCIIRSSQGKWNYTPNVNTRDFEIIIDSLILSGESNKEHMLEKLYEWCGSKIFELLYRGTKDGFRMDDFHRKCDNKGKNIVLLKNTSGHIFGGFASVAWESPFTCAYKQAPGSFLFTLTNMYGIEPTKFPLKDDNCVCAVEHDNNWGPTFGSGRDLIISSYCNTNDSYTSFPRTYNDSTGKGRSIFTSNTSTIDSSFKLREFEVFRVI